MQIDAGQGGPTAYLPVPYAPVDLRIGGVGWEELAGSLMILSPVQGLSGLKYTVTSHEADPTPTDIDKPTTQFVPGPVQAAYGTYAGPDANKLLTIARDHTQGALTQLQAATDLQDWLLSRQFAYTLKPNLPASSHWLLSFLTTHRRGYCQQFAWAFAVLARLVGIPSRVVVGYTGGSTYRSWRLAGHHHRCACLAGAVFPWPGLAAVRADAACDWRPGHGHRAPIRHGPATGPNPPLPGGQSQSQTNPGGGAGSSKKSPGLNRITHPEARRRWRERRGQSDLGLWLGIGIPVLIFLLLAWPALARVLTRRRRWLAASGDAAQAEAAWRELTDDLSDYGLGCNPGETPRAVARRVRWPGHSGPRGGPGAAEDRRRQGTSQLRQAGRAGCRAGHGPADRAPGHGSVGDGQAAAARTAPAGLHADLGQAAPRAGRRTARLAGFLVAGGAAPAVSRRAPTGLGQAARLAVVIALLAAAPALLDALHEAAIGWLQPSPLACVPGFSCGPASASRPSADNSQPPRHC